MVLTENDSIHEALDWDALYWEHMPRVYNFFRYRIGDNDIANDLTSTTFTKAWRARHQYQHNLGVFSAWLFTIARNVANDYLRKVQRRKEVPLDTIWGLVSEVSVEREAQKRREFKRLHILLQNLPSREQEIIGLKFGASLTNRSIADIVGLSESNVGTILHRTMDKLRRHWDKEVYN